MLLNCSGTGRIVLRNGNIWGWWFVEPTAIRAANWLGNGVSGLLIERRHADCGCARRQRGCAVAGDTARRPTLKGTFS